MSQHHPHHLPPTTTKLFSSQFKEKSDPKQILSIYRFTLLILLFFAIASFLKLYSFSQSPIPLNSHKFSSQSSPPPPPPSCPSLITYGPTNSTPNFLCCDRSHFRTDVCYMLGDVRTSPADHRSIFLVARSPDNKTEEKIRPYTRKWEKEIMITVDELTLRATSSSRARRCDVQHAVPAIVFSAGGYTGNVYHEFNDGLIPLYVTAARFAGEVVLVVAEYHEWWFVKYERILGRISNYGIVDLRRDKRVHCFHEMIVGLKIHGDLAIDSNLMHNGKTIHDFQSLVAAALASPHPHPAPRRPNLTILLRHRSRRLLNLPSLLRLVRRSGFHPSLLSPDRSTPLSQIHRSLSSSDALIAVHGAALTHLLFMKPGSVLIQIVPLGLDWPAQTYYAEPARRAGLHYLGYNVTAEESSLFNVYPKDDPVLVDTKIVTKKGWAETKRVYMDRQDVNLNLKRFGKFVREAKEILMKVG